MFFLPFNQSLLHFSAQRIRSWLHAAGSILLLADLLRDTI